MITLVTCTNLLLLRPDRKNTNRNMRVAYAENFVAALDRHFDYLLDSWTISGRILLKHGRGPNRRSSAN
jgi:hypothetical protein